MTLLLVMACLLVGLPLMVYLLRAETRRANAEADALEYERTRAWLVQLEADAVDRQRGFEL